MQAKRLNEEKRYTRMIKCCLRSGPKSLYILYVSLEIRREKPAQEQARVFSRNSPPLTSGGSLWAGEVVTGETTPERKGEALSLIYSFLFFVIQPTLARYKCRK